MSPNNEGPASAGRAAGWTLGGPVAHPSAMGAGRHSQDQVAEAATLTGTYQSCGDAGAPACAGLCPATAGACRRPGVRPQGEFDNLPQESGAQITILEGARHFNSSGIPLTCSHVHIPICVLSGIFVLRGAIIVVSLEHFFVTT